MDCGGQVGQAGHLVPLGHRAMNASLEAPGRREH